MLKVKTQVLSRVVCCKPSVAVNTDVNVSGCLHPTTMLINFRLHVRVPYTSMLMFFLTKRANYATIQRRREMVRAKIVRCMCDVQNRKRTKNNTPTNILFAITSNLAICALTSVMCDATHFHDSPIPMLRALARTPKATLLFSMFFKTLRFNIDLYANVMRNAPWKWN